MDYDAYLDDEVRAFIARTKSFYPDDAAGMGIADQRRVYGDLCRGFAVDHPAGVSAGDRDANGVPLRIYEIAEATLNVIYMHGGGFVLGGLDSHDSICAEICAGTGYRVISVDYRLAPEHLHPAAFDDCLGATAWVLQNFTGPVVLAGDSAGGNLAAAVAHAMRDSTDRLAGQVLIYPALASTRPQGSSHVHAHAPGLTTADITYYDQTRTGGQIPEGDARFEPLDDSDFSGLPATVIVTADCDPLDDDGRWYRDALAAAGGKVHWRQERGLIHGFLRARHMSKKAGDSFAFILAAIGALGQGAWPYDEGVTGRSV